MIKKPGPLSRGVFAIILSAYLVAACTSTQNRDTAGLEKPEGATATYTELAKGYLARGNTSAAFENAEKAVKADDSNAEAHTIMGLLLQQAGDNKNAAKHYVRAKKLSPYDPYISNAYGAYLCNNGLYGEADKEFLAAASSPLNPSPWVALTNAGLCFERAGQYALASQRLQSALNLKSDFPQARSAMKRIKGRG
jgi:type IV pilus assembly protein PilF